MKHAPFLHLGLLQILAGIILLIGSPYKLFGLIFVVVGIIYVTIKVIWVIRHKEELDPKLGGSGK